MKDKKLNIGIIGCGTIADIHAQALEKVHNANLISAYSRNEENLNPFCEKYEVKKFSNWNEFISDNELDAVSICTPSGTHLDYAKLAAEKGKHVIVEKPIEVTIERAKELIDICDKNNVALAVIYQNRFIDSIIEMKSRIDSGAIGKLFLADAYIKWFRSQEYYNSAEWRGTLELDGGGVLINQAIHTIDLLIWLAGDIKSVTAKTGTFTHKGIEGEDNAVAVLNFQNGALGVIEASTSVKPAMPRKIELHGNEGSIILEGDDVNYSNDKITGKDDGKEKKHSGGSSPLAGFSIEPHKRQFEQIFNAIMESTEPIVSGNESLKSLAVVKAIYKSSLENREVLLEEFYK